MAGESVLVVDDSDVNCTLLRRRLEKAQYRVTIARDGREALERIEAETFDLVLLDVVMPEVGGLEVLESVRKRFSVSELPIIMATSNDESADIVNAFNLGANDYVTKPFDFAVVMARVGTQLQLRRLNQFIRGMFGRYVDNDIVAQLLDNNQQGLPMSGEKRSVTVLMADLRGFSSVAERLPPESVVSMLNNYLTVMTDVIMSCGGTIDEFIGDAILVLFGAPVQRADHARAAVECALRMQLAIPEVNRRNAEASLPAVEMGVGINTGEVVVGNIGSERRTKYGVVGHHVNLASRIESYTLGGQVLVSEATLKEAGVAAASTLSVLPKGFPEPITLYAIRTMGDLQLPEIADTLVELATPVHAQFVVLDGKDSRGALTDAEIIGLSAREALVRGDAPPVMVNVKLHVQAGEAPLYGKVTESATGSFRVHFTSVPDDVAQTITRVLQR